MFDRRDSVINNRADKMEHAIAVLKGRFFGRGNKIIF